MVGEKLVFAGGTNFAGTPPWEGGVKVWSPNIYQLDSPEGTWRAAGKLDRPLAYGASVSIDEGLLLIGGGDSEKHYPDVLLLRPDEEGVFETERLSELPIPSAYCAAIVHDRKVYVVSGMQGPDSEWADKRFWRLDLAERNADWEELPVWPGPARVMAVMAVAHNEVFLVSGRAVDPGLPREDSYLTDAYAYDIGAKSWRSLPALSFPAAGIPSPAPVTDDGRVLILGGNDGTLAHVFPIASRRNFPAELHVFEPKKNGWSQSGTLPFAQKVTPTIHWRGRWIVPSGELRPGIRTPTVWAGQ